MLRRLAAASLRRNLRRRTGRGSPLTEVAAAGYLARHPPLAPRNWASRKLLADPAACRCEAAHIRQMEEAVKLIVKMWTEPRTTLHGRYFHVEDAILEPKPVQRPRPPVLIAGSSEQLTLRAVARLADACNFVDAEIAEVRHKLAVLADIATPRVAITTRPKRPISGLGFSRATTPRCRRSASGW